MSDIIYRDDAMKAIDGMMPAQGNMAQEIMKALCWAAVTTIPKPVDAVEVVRCKNCKHCFSIDSDPLTPYDGESHWYCEKFDYDWNVLALDPCRFFCADGERRDEE